MKIEEKNYYVYIHKNKVNGKEYIGITKQPPQQRWGVNGSNYSQSRFFYTAIQKYGWDNFDHKVLFSNLTKDEACQKEIQLIKEHKTQNRAFGYNIASGGMTPTMDETTKQIISEKLKGNKNGFGKPCSEEKKMKISLAQKGNKFTEEHKLKISLAKKGKSHAPISLEARKKIADKHKKKQVYCLELDKVFESVQECARQIGAYATNIVKCCKGKIKSTKGYHLSYYNTI